VRAFVYRRLFDRRLALSSLAVAIAMIAAASTPAAVDRATRASPVSGWIVFGITRGGRTILVASSLDGRWSRRIGAGGSAMFSPDGRSVAFITGVATRSAGLWVVNVRAGGARRLRLPAGVVQRPSELAWSPDGRWLAIARHSGASCAPERVEDLGLYIVRVDGSGLRQLQALPPSAEPLAGNPTEIHDIRWSPRGRRLAFLLTQGSDNECRGPYLRPAQVVAVELASERPVGLARASFPHDLQWAPSGRELAFVDDTEGGGGLKGASLRGRTRVISRRGANEVFVWTSRGIYATVYYGRALRLALVNAATGATRDLAASGEATSVSDASPSGLRVAVKDWRHHVRVITSDGRTVFSKRIVAPRGYRMEFVYDVHIDFARR
jgi:Tol biopolymer transport system component